MNATIGLFRKKKFYEGTSEFERRLCEKDLKQAGAELGQAQIRLSQLLISW